MGGAESKPEQDDLDLAWDDEEQAAVDSGWEASENEAPKAAAPAVPAPTVAASKPVAPVGEAPRAATPAAAAVSKPAAPAQAVVARPAAEKPAPQKAASPLPAPVPEKKADPHPPRSRKERQRARAAEKVERRKARAAAVEAKQKKPQRRDDDARSGVRSKGATSDPQLADLAAEEPVAPRSAPARKPAAAAQRKSGVPRSVIAVLAVLLVAGALAILLAQR